MCVVVCLVDACGPQRAASGNISGSPRILSMQSWARTALIHELELASRLPRVSCFRWAGERGGVSREDDQAGVSVEFPDKRSEFNMSWY